MSPTLCIDIIDVDRLRRTVFHAARTIRDSHGRVSDDVSRLRTEGAWQIPGWDGIEVDLGRALGTMESLASHLEATSRSLARYVSACDGNEQAKSPGFLQEVGQFFQNAARGAEQLASYLLHNPQSDVRLGADLGGALAGELLLDAAAGGEAVGAALDVTGIGAVLGVPVNVAAAGLGVAGAGIMLASGAKLGKDLADAAKAANQEEFTAQAGDGRLPIPEATRLKPVEQATAGRLKAKLGDALTNLRESPHDGADYVGTFNGRECTFDATGAPDASTRGRMDQVLLAIRDHIFRKSNDYAVVDLTGFRADQIDAVNGYLDTLSPAARAKVIRIGF